MVTEERIDSTSRLAKTDGRQEQIYQVYMERGERNKKKSKKTKKSEKKEKKEKKKKKKKKTVKNKKACLWIGIYILYYIHRAALYNGLVFLPSHTPPHVPSSSSSLSSFLTLHPFKPTPTTP